MLPPYVPPRHRNAPEATILKNGKILLIAVLVPKGVKVVKYILPNVKNLSYIDHDMKPPPELDHKNYMDSVEDTLEAPQQYVAKEWVTPREIWHIIVVVYATFWE